MIDIETIKAVIPAIVFMFLGFVVGSTRVEDDDELYKELAMAFFLLAAIGSVFYAVHVLS